MENYYSFQQVIDIMNRVKQDLGQEPNVTMDTLHKFLKEKGYMDENGNLTEEAIRSGKFFFTKDLN